MPWYMPIKSKPCWCRVDRSEMSHYCLQEFYMYICACTHMSMYIYEFYICVCTQIYIHIWFLYMCMHTHVCVRMSFIYVHAHTSVYIWVLYMCTHTHVCVHMSFIYVHAHTCLCMCNVSLARLRCVWSPAQFGIHLISSIAVLCGLCPTVSGQEISMEFMIDYWFLYSIKNGSWDPWIHSFAEKY
jgi:hypothetical protein